MANEITKSFRISASKNGLKSDFAPPSAKESMTGDEVVNNTQVIGTTAELLNLGEISGAPGLVMIQNLDNTNFVEIGGDSGLTVFKLKIDPGEEVLIRPSTGTVYLKADTAPCRVWVFGVSA